MSGGGGYAPNFLLDLGSMFAAAKLHVVVCEDCGLVRFFAEEKARAKLPKSKKWERWQQDPASSVGESGYDEW